MKIINIIMGLILILLILGCTSQTNPNPVKCEQNECAKCVCPLTENNPSNSKYDQTDSSPDLLVGKCTFPSGFACIDAAGSTEGVELKVQNAGGFDMTNTNIVLVDAAANGSNVACTLEGGNTLTNGEADIAICIGTFSEGKLNTKIQLYYTNKQTTIQHTSFGELILKIENSPDVFSPEKCTFQQGFACLDMIGTTDNIVLRIQNANGFDVSYVEITLVDANNTEIICQLANGNKLVNGAADTIDCKGSFAPGRFIAHINLRYTNMQTTVSHIKTGELNLKIDS